ncbi:MAG: hypothetical protein WBO48_01300, partial [Candidatus Promineifilaceae bacterium]
MPVTNPSAGNGRDRMGLAAIIIVKGHAVFSPIIHIAQHHPLTVNVGTAGRPPHHLAKPDEVWAERPLPTP